MKTNVLISLLIILFTLSSNDCKKQDHSDSEERVVKIETTLGDIVIKLYNETPLHRDNFIKLVENGFYDSLLFHRIIKDFMIQTGDPYSRNAAKNITLGIGGPGYTVPAEINPLFTHKKGALAAARQGDRSNPERASSGSQFYIVVGKILTDEQITASENNINNMKKGKLYQEIFKEELAKFDEDISKEKKQEIHENAVDLTNEEFEKLGGFSYTEKQKEDYKTIGGTPHLDGAYSVFGEVIEGLDVVDKICLVETNNRSNRPLEDLVIKITIVK